MDADMAGQVKDWPTLPSVPALLPAPASPDASRGGRQVRAVIGGKEDAYVTWIGPERTIVAGTPRQKLGNLKITLEISGGNLNETINNNLFGNRFDANHERRG